MVMGAITPRQPVRPAPTKWFGPTPPRPPAPRPPAPRPPVVADRVPPSRTTSTGASRPTISPAADAAEQRRQTAYAQNTAMRFPSSGGGGPVSSAAPVETGGGGGGGGEIDWRDSAYAAQIAAINRALADYETELGLRAGDYGTDYLTGLRQLGYRPGEGFSANVDIFSLPVFEGTDKKGQPKPLYPQSEAVSEAVQAAMPKVTAAGQWDYEGEFSPFSAASRGTRTARDEFAGRGTLRSSDFAKAYADFQNRMQEQLNAMEQGRGRYYRDAALDLGQQRAQAEERRQAARRDAMMRAAMSAAG